MGMIDMQFTLAAREWLLGASVVMFAVVFAAILASHWHHHKHAQAHFHTSSLTEMAWSVAPMVMVFVTGLAGISSVFSF
jgi:heme/copper-type cytochrome/quinol oxidase subunit 2